MKEIKFQVYNGPKPKFCKRCNEEICYWLSDTFCFEHACQHVKQYDLNKKFATGDFNNG